MQTFHNIGVSPFLWFSCTHDHPPVNLTMLDSVDETVTPLCKHCCSYCRCEFKLPVILDKSSKTKLSQGDEDDLLVIHAYSKVRLCVWLSSFLAHFPVILEKSEEHWDGQEDEANLLALAWFVWVKLADQTVLNDWLISVSFCCVCCQHGCTVSDSGCVVLTVDGCTKSSAATRAATCDP